MYRFCSLTIQAHYFVDLELGPTAGSCFWDDAAPFFSMANLKVLFASRGNYFVIINNILIDDRVVVQWERAPVTSLECAPSAVRIRGMISWK